MPDTHDDYPLAEVLGSGDLIHHARTLGRFGSRIETRCGLQGRKTGRDGGVWCPECKVRQPAAVDTHAAASGNESGPFRDDLRSQLVAAGTEAAEQWLADRAYRKMSDINRKRLAGHVVNALWTEIERAVLEMAPYFANEQLAAEAAHEPMPRITDGITAAAAEASATFDLTIDEVRTLKADRDAAIARAESATVLHDRWKALLAERNAAAARAQKAEVQLMELGEPETEYRFLLADGSESESEPHSEGPCGCRREQRTVRAGTWHAAADAARDDRTADGRTAEENTEFEKLYGVEAAMRLRAANDRVWRIVQELRRAAVDAGRDAYQDPMAQRLSAALVGTAAVPGPRPAKSSTLIEVFLRVSGLTPDEVGRLLGVSTGAVSAWRRGAVMNAARFARLDELNRLAQQVPSATFYDRRASIMSPRAGKPSIYQQWLAESRTPPIDPPGEAAHFEADPADVTPDDWSATEPVDCPSPYRDGTCRHLTCARCKQHTNNTHQGHYWAWCKVTKTTREFHFCCPGDCELGNDDTAEGR